MRQRTATLTSITAIALLAALAAPLPADTEMFKIENAGEALVFYPTLEARGFVLTVTGPCRYEYRTRVEKGEIVFKLPKDAMAGAYSYSIDVVPIIDREIMEILAKARKTGDDEEVRRLCREGALPTGPTSQSGGFAVVESRIVLDTRSENEREKYDEGEKGERGADLIDFRLPGNDELADRLQAAGDPAATTASSAGECLWARMKPLGLDSGR